MVKSRRRWPEVGEYVVGTISRVESHGAYAILDEYNKSEGMIHISEVAASWVRNIRNFVRERQKIVAKVLNVNPYKGRMRIVVNDYLTFNMGLRMSGYMKPDSGMKFGFEPRLSSRILLNNRSSIKLSYNRNFQYISLISSSKTLLGMIFSPYSASAALTSLKGNP